MQFRVIDSDDQIPDSGSDTIYLSIDNWNDFSFVTQFHMYLHDKVGNLHSIGNIKIGFKGQTEETATYKKLSSEFEQLDPIFFSLGENAKFYKNLNRFSHDNHKILAALNDIVLLPKQLESVRAERVLSSSLLRDTSLSVIKGQYTRIVSGGVELTNYDFEFEREERQGFGSLSLSFNVEVNSKPSTNIHAIIGRNGVGKTTLLNGMIEAITKPDTASAKFYDTRYRNKREIDDSYFSSLVSVCFSAFDPFTPPPEQPDPAKGTCYFYIGLKNTDSPDLHRNISALQSNCVNALTHCFRDREKTKRWLNAIKKLGSDENFASMSLQRLVDIFQKLRQQSKSQSDSKDFRAKYHSLVMPDLKGMSSGHAIVLLTITRLVATVQQKTLVLLDEPESHLHPPLLSALIRAVSDLLLAQNGVAIIATHSPVVLQEIPKSCVWKIYRRGASVQKNRPAIETFAENVGVLTSEVFSLEVERSGFHELLKKSVSNGRTYKDILSDYDNKMGFEGRAILKAMIAERDRAVYNDEIE